MAPDRTGAATSLLSPTTLGGMFWSAPEVARLPVELVNIGWENRVASLLQAAPAPARSATIAAWDRIFEETQESRLRIDLLAPHATNCCD
jgi:hypothetical protein